MRCSRMPSPTPLRERAACPVKPSPFLFLIQVSQTGQTLPLGRLLVGSESKIPLGFRQERNRDRNIPQPVALICCNRDPLSAVPGCPNLLARKVARHTGQAFGNVE